MPKVTPVSQDSKVLLVSPVQRVSMGGPVPRVSLELPADQESPADLEHLDCQERKVKRVVMGSPDRLESKESQGFLVTVALVLLGFQGRQVQRETQVFLAHLAVLVSPALKERLDSPAHLVLQVTVALLDLQDWLCRAPKDSKDLLDHPEEQVPLVHKVPADLQEVEVLRERRVFLALLASRASLDRREKLVVLDSRVPLDFLVALVPKEISVFLAFPDSLDQRETQDSLVAVAFLEIPEMWEDLALPVTPVYLRLPSW